MAVFETCKDDGLPAVPAEVILCYQTLSLGDTYQSDILMIYS